MFNKYPKKSSGGWNDKKSGGFGGNKSGGWQNGGARKQMHMATCAECGNSCQVPFKPNGRKPVLCSNCFEQGGGNGGDDRRPDRFDRDDRRSFEKPAYRSTPRAGNDDVSKQLKMLNDKMDQILDALFEIGDEEEGEA